MFQVISCSIAVSSGNAGGSASATAAAGLPAPSDKPLDGMNLLSILRSETPAPARNLFWTCGSNDGWLAEVQPPISGDVLRGRSRIVALIGLASSAEGRLWRAVPETVGSYRGAVVAALR